MKKRISKGLVSITASICVMSFLSVFAFTVFGNDVGGIDPPDKKIASAFHLTGEDLPDKKIA